VVCFVFEMSSFMRFTLSEIIEVTLRSLEWALAAEPLTRYEPPTDCQHAFVGRLLPIPNVFLDAFDLMCNKRGIGWLWSSELFPSPSTRPTSIALILAGIFVKFTVWDFCLYTVQHLWPSANDPACDIIFDLAPGLRGLIYSVLRHVGVHRHGHVLPHCVAPSLVLGQPPNRPWVSTRSWISGDSAGTSSSVTCSLSSARGPAAHCSGRLGRC